MVLGVLRPGFGAIQIDTPEFFAKIAAKKNARRRFLIRSFGDEFVATETQVAQDFNRTRAEFVRFRMSRGRGALFEYDVRDAEPIQTERRDHSGGPPAYDQNFGFQTARVFPVGFADCDRNRRVFRFRDVHD